MSPSLPPQDAARGPAGPQPGHVQRLAGALAAGARLVAARLERLGALVAALPGGTSLWVGLASAGFLLAALVANGRQLQQLSLDGQGWAWLLLGLGLALLSLVVNGLAWTLGLAWLGHRPRWLPAVLLFLRSNLRKYLPGGVWHLMQRLAVLRQVDPGLGIAGAESPVAAPLDLRQGLVAVLVDPVYGGVSASLAMLGDINIAEPRAYIGFAGQDVIRQTVREKLPEGFQRAEFLLEHGAIDMIVHRHDMKARISSLIGKLLPDQLQSIPVLTPREGQVMPRRSGFSRGK